MPSSSELATKLQGMEQRVMALVKAFVTRHTEDKDKKFKDLENDPEKKKQLQAITKKLLDAVSEKEAAELFKRMKEGAERFRQNTPMIIMNVNVGTAGAPPTPNKTPLKWSVEFLTQNGQRIGDVVQEQSDNEPHKIKIKNVPNAAWGQALRLRIEGHQIFTSGPGQYPMFVDYITAPIPVLHETLPVQITDTITIAAAGPTPTAGGSGQAQPPKQTDIDREAQKRGDETSIAWLYDDKTKEAKHFREALQAIADMIDKKDPGVVHIFENQQEVDDAAKANGMVYRDYETARDIVKTVVDGFKNVDARQQSLSQGWTVGLVKQKAGQLISIWGTIRTRKQAAQPRGP